VNEFDRKQAEGFVIGIGLVILAFIIAGLMMM
jgi:hypothetical protein